MRTWFGVCQAGARQGANDGLRPSCDLHRLRSVHAHEEVACTPRRAVLPREAGRAPADPGCATLTPSG